MHPTPGRRVRRALSILIAVLAFGAFGVASASSASAEEQSLTIGVWSGDGQVTTPGRQFADPLMIRTQGSDPGIGATVVFLIDGPNAVFVTEDGQQLSGVSAVIDPNGFATSPPVLAGQATGAFTVEAQVSGTTTSNAVLFDLSIDALAPTTMTVVSGAGQTTLVGDQFAQPMIVVVFDQLGDPVAGASVTFTIPVGSVTFAGGDLAFAATTDALGSAASPPLVAGASPGEGSVVATAEGGSNPSATIELQVATLLMSATEVGAGETVHVSSSGFGAAEPVEVRLDGVPAATATSDADGRVEVDFVVPSDVLAGPHVLELAGASTAPRSATLFVRVGVPAAASDPAAPAPSLPETGTDARPAVLVAAAMLLAAAAASVVVAARRAARRRS